MWESPLNDPYFSSLLGLGVIHVGDWWAEISIIASAGLMVAALVASVVVVSLIAGRHQES